jgi:hypothetical protein
VNTQIHVLITRFLAFNKAEEEARLAKTRKGLVISAAAKAALQSAPKNKERFLLYLHSLV